MPLLRAVNTNSSPVLLMLYKLIAISTMVMQSLFQATALIRAEHGFIVDGSTSIKELMPVHYIMVLTPITSFRFIGSLS